MLFFVLEVYAFYDDVIKEMFAFELITSFKHAYNFIITFQVESIFIFKYIHVSGAWYLWLMKAVLFLDNTKYSWIKMEKKDVKLIFYNVFWAFFWYCHLTAYKIVHSIHSQFLLLLDTGNITCCLHHISVLYSQFP